MYLLHQATSLLCSFACCSQADDEAGVDDLRLKTAAKFAAGQAPELEGSAPKRMKRSL
jgi:hypothetical protein